MSRSAEALVPGTVVPVPGTGGHPRPPGRGRRGPPRRRSRVRRVGHLAGAVAGRRRPGQGLGGAPGRRGARRLTYAGSPDRPADAARRRRVHRHGGPGATRTQSGPGRQHPTWERSTHTPPSRSWWGRARTTSSAPVPAPEQMASGPSWTCPREAERCSSRTGPGTASRSRSRPAPRRPTRSGRAPTDRSAWPPRRRRSWPAAARWTRARPPASPPRTRPPCGPSSTRSARAGWSSWRSSATTPRAVARRTTSSARPPPMPGSRSWSRASSRRGAARCWSSAAGPTPRPSLGRVTALPLRAAADPHRRHLAGPVAAHAGRRRLDPGRRGAAGLRHPRPGRPGVQPDPGPLPARPGADRLGVPGLARRPRGRRPHPSCCSPRPGPPTCPRNGRATRDTRRPSPGSRAARSPRSARPPADHSRKEGHVPHPTRRARAASSAPAPGRGHPPPQANVVLVGLGAALVVGGIIFATSGQIPGILFAARPVPRLRAVPQPVRLHLRVAAAGGRPPGQGAARAHADARRGLHPVRSDPGHPGVVRRRARRRRRWHRSGSGCSSARSCSGSACSSAAPARPARCSPSAAASRRSCSPSAASSSAPSSARCTSRGGPTTCPATHLCRSRTQVPATPAPGRSRWR